MSDSQTVSDIGPSAGDLDRWLGQLGGQWPAEDDATLIDQIARLERMKGALCAAQAGLTVALKELRIAERQAAHVRVSDLTKGIGAEIALARRQSPYWGARFVGFSDALIHEMPHTLQALTTGEMSEYRAGLLVAETACLTREHRSEVDRQLGERLGSMSDRQLRAEAKRIAYRLDPYAVLDRSRKAEADRRVTSWPAPDTMMNVCALLPVVQGAAVMAALTRAADLSRATGDGRSKGQTMADTFVERITGQSSPDQTPVEVQLVMTDQVLFGDDQTPAWLHGYGPVPAAYSRTLLRGLDDDTVAWLRRILTDPVTGLITAIDKRRLITGNLRRAIIIRDQWCRTPWCGAPIRHGDHVIPHQDGGESTEANGQGLCEACNYAKEARGWHSRPGPGGAGQSVQITTPTGHTYESRPPPLPGWPRIEEPAAAPRQLPVIEVYLRPPIDLEYAA